MDFTNINTESQSGHSSARGRAGTEPRCPGGRSSNLHGARCLFSPRPCPQKGEKTARALLLTFALVRQWQCTYDFCSLGSYPGKCTNSQLIGIECGVT